MDEVSVVVLSIVDDEAAFTTCPGGGWVYHEECQNGVPDER